MKEQKNILVYGFLLFLIIVGTISIFYQDEKFIQSINSLSIPILLFTIAALIAKANSYVRKELFDKISYQEKMSERCGNLVLQAEKNAERSNHAEEDERLLGLSRNEAFRNNVYLTLLYKRSVFVCNISQVVNTIAMLSFVFCLLSLTGIFPINTNFPWINVFSLALVFFDFFILDDWLRKYVSKTILKIQEQTEDNFEKALKENDK